MYDSMHWIGAPVVMRLSVPAPCLTMLHNQLPSRYTWSAIQGHSSTSSDSNFLHPNVRFTIHLQCSRRLALKRLCAAARRLSTARLPAVSSAGPPAGGLSAPCAIRKARASRINSWQNRCCLFEKWWQGAFAQDTLTKAAEGRVLPWFAKLGTVSKFQLQIRLGFSRTEGFDCSKVPQVPNLRVCLCIAGQSESGMPCLSWCFRKEPFTKKGKGLQEEQGRDRRCHVFSQPVVHMDIV